MQEKLRRPVGSCRNLLFSSHTHFMVWKEPGEAGETSCLKWGSILADHAGA